MTKKILILLNTESFEKKSFFRIVGSPLLYSISNLESYYEKSKLSIIYNDSFPS